MVTKNKCFYFVLKSSLNCWKKEPLPRTRKTNGLSVIKKKKKTNLESIYSCQLHQVQ